MRLLVADLKKRKYAVTDKPQARQSKPANEKKQLGDEINPRQRGADNGKGTGERGVEGAGGAEGTPTEPRKRTRYIPARVRRAVWQRDRGRCTFVDARGERCRETRYLELHHVDPHGRGGPPTEANLYLRCRAHNVLAAEEDFGRDFMTVKKRMAANKPEGPFTPL
jgi:hypothetical protein